MVRIAAVISAAQALAGNEVDWKLAVANFKSIGQGAPASHVASHHTDYIKKWWGNFITHGNVDDAPRPGRPPLLPDDVAQHAADLVKEGQWVWALPAHVHVRKQVLFRSIPQAIRTLPELSAICSQYNITSDQLRNAMERVDPDLTMHTFHFKYAHSAELLVRRQSYCKEKMAWLEAEEAARTPQLDSIVWWDEGTVQISALEHRSIRLWSSKEALHSVDVLHLPAVQGQLPCKIHFIIAVSSHPACTPTNGLVYFEFTTGTTHGKRLQNYFREDDGEVHEYQVSKSGLTDCVAKCIVTHQAVQLYCLQQPCVVHAWLQPVSA